MAEKKTMTIGENREEEESGKVYILLNSKANNGQGITGKEEVYARIKEKWGGNLIEKDLTSLDVERFVSSLHPRNTVVLFGGDGTLNCFVNDLRGRPLPCPFFFSGGGTGNDFLRDVDEADKEEFVELNPHLCHLPVVEVNGKKRRFLNNVGFGIDGEVCVQAENEKAKGKKKISYSGLAIKLMLFHYKPTKARVTVDGEVHEYKHVWLATVMNGRYYGGGMKACPEQKRGDKTISILVFTGRSRLHTLLVFKNIFTGTHVKSKLTHILSGHTIKVEYDAPRPLQIDGELELGVTSYEAHKEEA